MAGGAGSQDARDAPASKTPTPAPVPVVPARAPRTWRAKGLSAELSR